MSKKKNLLIILASCCAVAAGYGATIAKIDNHTNDRQIEQTEQQESVPENESGEDRKKLPEAFMSDKVRLTFVSINDLHGAINEQDGRAGIAVTDRMIDSMSRFYNDDDDKTTDRDDIVLFANGDMFQGEALSSVSHGQPVVEVMNLMGFDGMGLGNHEFDWGLDAILPYWDGSADGTKAEFELVTSNVADKSEGNDLIGDISDSDKIASTLLINKMGVNVGLIAVLGPCSNSIGRENMADYEIRDVVESVEDAAMELKAQGADIISVNIHYSQKGDVLDYEDNEKVANLKDRDGSYLVDIIFNGHTHDNSMGEIKRDDGSIVPVVQAGCANEAIAYVTVEYDKKQSAVSGISYEIKETDSAKGQESADVKLLVSKRNNDFEKKYDVLAMSGYTVKHSTDMLDYVCRLMCSDKNADYACINRDLIRGNGDIKKGEEIKKTNIISLVPFDDNIFYVTISAKELYEYCRNNDENYYVANAAGDDIPKSYEGSDKKVRLAIIDYLFEHKRFDKYRSHLTDIDKTGKSVVEVIVEDIKSFGDDGRPWVP